MRAGVEFGLFCWLAGGLPGRCVRCAYADLGLFLQPRGGMPDHSRGTQRAQTPPERGCGEAGGDESDPGPRNFLISFQGFSDRPGRKTPTGHRRVAYMAIRVFLQRLGRMADASLSSGKNKPRRGGVCGEASGEVARVNSNRYSLWPFFGLQRFGRMADVSLDIGQNKPRRSGVCGEASGEVKLTPLLPSLRANIISGRRQAGASFHRPWTNRSKRSRSRHWLGLGSTRVAAG